VLITIFLLPLILAELYLRYVGLGDPILYYTNSSYRYAPLPNQRKQRLADSWVTIDSFGLRGTKPWDEDADFRVLFIGDSVTWAGTGIDDQDTFSNLTCIELANHWPHRFTCGNAGVSAYGTDNMTARLEYKSFGNEDAVVTTIINPDTIRGLTDLKSQYFFSSTPAGPFAATWEASTFLLFRFVSWLRHHSEIHIDQDDLLVAKKSLTNLFRVLKRKESEGKIVLVVLAPIAEELGRDDNAYTRLAKELLAEHQVNFVNLNPIVTSNYSNDIFSDDRHLKTDGHSLYAEAISNELLKYIAPVLNR
jgi:lysophospholipase L1-like esterase